MSLYYASFRVSALGCRTGRDAAIKRGNRELASSLRCLTRSCHTLPSSFGSVESQMETPIRTQEIWKTYGTTAAVCGLSLSVPPQSVNGFLGPNGAGKSTTIRMVLGLQRPNRGTISLFGRPLAAERIALLRRIGSLVESPSLYPHLTGRENLGVHRRLLGMSKCYIDEALETVDLISVADRLVRKYSSGMKQRLGLAQALLGKPELARVLLSGISSTVTCERNCLRIEPGANCEPAEINAILVKAGVAVSQLSTQHPTLEDFFLELTRSPIAEKEYAVR